MNLSEKQLQTSSTVFHGIVPGKSAYPIGRIKLDVAFGSDDNFGCESLTFEVVKIKSPYHALSGRPAYARFMARPCYVYLKLKMPGPKGVITINGNTVCSLRTEEHALALAAEFHYTDDWQSPTSAVKAPKAGKRARSQSEVPEPPTPCK